MSTVSSEQVFRFNLQGSFFCEVLSEQDSFKYAVMMPERNHLFPFRTQQLSVQRPRVLRWRRRGRLGSCRSFKELVIDNITGLFPFIAFINGCGSEVNTDEQTSVCTEGNLET